jgi:hypothetical protein
MSSDYSIGVVVAAAAAGKCRRVVRAFEEHQAVSPASARTLANLGHTESRHVNRLERAGVLSVTPETRYYLNRDRWQEMRAARRRRAFMVLGLVGLALLVYPLMSKS